MPMAGPGDFFRLSGNNQILFATSAKQRLPHSERSALQTGSAPTVNKLIKTHLPRTISTKDARPKNDN
jgi:hypothetical protein